MGIQVKLDLDADTSRLADAVQRAVSKGFQGAGNAGLATDPTSIIRQIAGGGFSGAGMKRRSVGSRNPSLPYTPDFLSDPSFFRPDSNRLRGEAQRAQFLKNIGFAGMPLLNPTSVFGNLFSARQLFSAASGPVGQGILGKVGLSGTGGAALATAGVIGALLAVGASLKLLQVAIRDTVAAYDQARKVYAHALLGGLGLNFSVGRKNIADVLGVSEKEVFQFGAAMAVLGPKLKFASDTVARTTPNLASVGWEFQVLQKNMQALFFTMANDAAPAIRKFVDGLSELVKMLTAFYNDIKGFISGIANSELTLNLLNAIPGFQQLSAFFKLASGFGHDTGAAPTPQALMKQLPVSAFERMGLVIGNFGGGADYARRTAQATERTAKAVTQIAQKAALPRGDFGMYVTSSNP